MDLELTLERGNLRKSSLITTEYDNISPYLNSEEISYPLGHLKGFPIISSSFNSVIYLYFPEDEYNYLKILLKADTKSVIRDSDCMGILQQFINAYFIKTFKNHTLENRINLSYEYNLAKERTYYSIAIEMPQKFKEKNSIGEKMRNFKDIKKDILKNINFEGGKALQYDPFQMLNFHNNNQNNNENYQNIQLVPKWGKSFQLQVDEETSEDSDEEYIEFMKKWNKGEIIKTNNDKCSYKKIIQDIFCNFLPDFRKHLVDYCLQKDKDYNNITFKKFIAFLEFFITLFSGIKVKYYIDELGFLDMDFYADETTFMYIAETLHYQTQFKILGISNYHQYKETSGNLKFKALKKASKSIKAEINTKIQINELNKLQYEYYDLNKVELFPPLTSFIKAFASKFRRYDSNDNYHLCENCENIENKNEDEIKCSSVFRNIDKSRMISSILHSIMDLNLIEKTIQKEQQNNFNRVFKFVLILQNHDELEENAKTMNIINAYVPPVPTISSYLINKTFRNLFGEAVGFYFTWITHYLKWIIFPAILGLLLHIFSIIINNNIMIIVYLVFSIIIILWGHFYVFSWKSYEKVYNTIWGMETFKIETSNLYDDNYSKVSYISFLGIKIPVVTKFDIILKKISTIIITLLSICAVVGTNMSVFYLQRIKFRVNKLFQKNILGQFPVMHRYGEMLIPILIFCIRELLSFAYKKIAKTLTLLERPTDKEEYLNNILKKRLMFEFFNYNYNLYYIAFIKKYFNNCEYDDCFNELAHQLTIILISDMISIISMLYYNGVYLRDKRKTFEKQIMEKYIYTKNKSKKFKYYTRGEITTEEIQNLCIPIIFNFGYIMQFGVCCPISFVFMLIFILFTRLANGINMIYLKYVKTMSESKGIGIFNKMQSLIIFVSLFTNIGLILYTHNYGNDFLNDKSKFIYFILIENSILLFLKIFKTSSEPFWYRYRDNIELRYLKRYGVRQKNLKERYKENFYLNEEESSEEGHFHFVHKDSGSSKK